MVKKKNQYFFADQSNYVALIVYKIAQTILHPVTMLKGGNYHHYDEYLTNTGIFRVGI